MSRYFLSTHPQVQILAWAAAREDVALPPLDTECLAVIDRRTETPAAVLAICCIREFTADAHLVTAGNGRWMTPSILAGFASFAFVYKALPRVTAPVIASNTNMQVLLLRAGFSFEGRQTGGGPLGQDIVLMGMTASDCRWLKKENV